MGLSNSGSALGGSSSAGLGSGATVTSANASNQPSTGGFIQADPSTNSLIITAPDPLYRQLRAVIDKLDGRRAQVLVESMIVEVKSNKLAQFGVQWQGAFGSKNDGVLGAIGTNSGAAGGNIITLTGALAGVATGTGTGTTATNPLSTIGGGLNIGLAPRFNGQYYLGALANFLQNSGEANVLSTPNLLTLDNEEAKILIGSNVPFLSGSYANATSTSGTVNPFNTVERKDVGLVLKVRPQINENGTVKLAVYQEVSKIDDSTRNDPNGATTSKRSIESNVLVEDGGIIVIGGLLEDDYSQGEDKVPVMGDIPVFGNLFRSENRKRTKTNLMVFLRPIVVRDTQVSDALMLDRYEAIRALQQNTQPEDRVMLRGVSEAPVLPAIRGDAGAAQPRMLTSQPHAGTAPAPAPAPAPAAPFKTDAQAPLPAN